MKRGPKKYFYGCLLTIIIFGAIFRFIGINWDQGQMLHPDERFLVMVTYDLDWPKSASQYFNTNQSPLNPNNRGYDFFVYGTLPIFLTKGLANIFNLAGYQDIIRLGRVLSAFFDFGVIFLVAGITKKIFNNSRASLWSALFYSISVLPIQLAHFYAVDTFLNFFITASFYWLVCFEKKERSIFLILASLSLGAAVACKIVALLFGPVLIIFLLRGRKNFLKILPKAVLVLAFFFLTWRILQPYAFIGLAKPNPQFLANLVSLKQMSKPGSWFPPTAQWFKTTPLIFPLKNLILWGLGVPLAIVVIMGLGKLVGQIKKNASPRPLGQYWLFLWPLSLFLFQGSQLAKPMRYFLPIYPFWIIAGGWGFYQLVKSKFLKSRPITVMLMIVLILVWPLSFLNIYLEPHSRVRASRWIYDHILPGSVLSCEYWDDCLPLALGAASPGQYDTEILHFYDPESPEKWQKINSQLERIDYLVLSSNRLWGSIPRNPKRYPETTKFYQDLFQNKLQFNKVAEFSSLPCFPPGLKWFCFDDQGADESFTVYDHPQVIIYQKVDNNNQSSLSN